ncbi:MAG TPA: NADP-dependent oxidoreductase [Cellulomonas sp.]
MRAIQIDRFGGPDVAVLRDVPDPVPGPGEVLVRTVAATVNPVDYKSRIGFVRNPEWRFPLGLGRDLAGVVVSSEDPAWRSGDAVVAAVPQWGSGRGSWAELVTVPGTLLAHAPRSLPLVEAAALPLAGLTAWQSLELADPQPGDHVLVVGAAGAVGSLVVQLAVARGLAVDALVTRDAHVALVRELGAGAATRDAAALPTGRYHVAIATASGVPVAHSLVPGGRYVTICDDPGIDDLEGHPVRHVSVREDGKDLASLVELVDARRLQARVARSYPVAEHLAACAAAEAGGLAGKVVLTF